jgi:FKBP-type peptidyl-prolyl cis-trans isomerase 2
MDYEMSLNKGDIIKLEYTGIVDGRVFISTSADVARENGIYDEDVSYGPRIVILGAGQIVPGLEEELIGKEPGHSGSVELPPEKAYGVRDPEKIETVMLNRFKDEKPYPGMRVSVDGRIGTVTRIVGRKATIDFNHPFADKTVRFDYRILERIEDREEKLRAMIKIFSDIELESRITDDVAEITVPWEISYFKDWLMIRRWVADMALRTLGLKEVRFVERHTPEDRLRAELISPPEKQSQESEGADRGEGSGGETQPGA